MDQRRFGSEGLTVSELRPGRMVVRELHGTGEEESTSTILSAIGPGVTFLHMAGMSSVNR